MIDFKETAHMSKAEMEARRLRMQRISNRRLGGALGDMHEVLPALTYEHPDGCRVCGKPMNMYNDTDRCSPCYSKEYPFL